MLSLGTQAPDFKLLDVCSGKSSSLADLKSDKATVIMFICNHCPFVKHLIPALPRLAKEYTAKGISFIAISSNDVLDYPDDSPEKMKELAESAGFVFPYLYDETQEVARSYEAACTPDFYIFDEDLKLAYRGRFDESRPNSEVPVDGRDLAAALDALLAREDVSSDQHPSVGCNIKWKN